MHKPLICSTVSNHSDSSNGNETTTRPTYLAVGVGAACCADLVPGEPAAGLEGVAGEAARAAADGDVAAHVAVGARAARRRAGVDAVVVLARLLVAAVAVRHAVTAEALLQQERFKCLLD